MGGDGGSIAQRTELVRNKKKPEQLARDIKIAARWRYCALTQELLQEPIVTCPLGRLYNKEAIVRALIDKTIHKIDKTKHILSLKDVKELNLTKNPDLTRLGADKGDAYVDPNVARFICPVVGVEMNGKYRFCAIWSCGCVLSERALKEIKSDACQKCGKPFSHDDIVVLYGTDEEIAEYSKKLEVVHEAQKLEKASKKTSKKNLALNDNKGVKRKADNQETKPPNVSKIKGDAAAEVNGQAKPSSVQSDSTKSQVFKSLFTSSEEAKNQPKAHWVTHNPLYY